MGIVAYCPQGHRVKVKDELAGKKGLCPICGVKFRIPEGDGGTRHDHGGAETAHGEGDRVEHAPLIAEAGGAGLPTARFVAIDPAVVATLPRALPVAASVAPAAATVMPSAPEMQRPLHPTIAERPDLTWSIALPGGDPSPPLPAAAMQEWLDARGWTGEEFVWRADWPQWLPFRQVFSDSAG